MDLVTYVEKNFLYVEIKLAEREVEIFKKNCEITGDFIDGISKQEHDLQKLLKEKRKMVFAVKFIVEKMGNGFTLMDAFYQVFEKFPEFCKKYKPHILSLFEQ